MLKEILPCGKFWHYPSQYTRTCPKFPANFMVQQGFLIQFPSPSNDLTMLLCCHLVPALVEFLLGHASSMQGLLTEGRTGGLLLCLISVGLLGFIGCNLTPMVPNIHVKPLGEGIKRFGCCFTNMKMIIQFYLHFPSILRMLLMF